jgi:hypothetical protein
VGTKDVASTRRPHPRVRSARALKVIASTATLFTFGGMTAFAATHLQNPEAPLRPPVAAAEPAATHTPVPVRTATPRRDQQRIAPQIPTTTAPPRTKTHRS